MVFSPATVSGVKLVRWRLLSHRVPETLEQAEALIDWGRVRWEIEWQAVHMLNKKPPPKTAPSRNAVVRLIASLGGCDDHIISMHARGL